jgi:hypothetical protein
MSNTLLIERLINWNVDVITRLLMVIVARREAQGRVNTGDVEFRTSSSGNSVLDEVQDIIRLPAFDGSAFETQMNPDSITIGPRVVQEMAEYVSVIAELYRRNNSLHNFEHASHVLMSVSKLLSQIVILTL